MGISFVKSLGSSAGEGTSGSRSVVLSAGVAAGNSVVVLVAAQDVDTSKPRTCTDTQGNTYTKIYDTSGTGDTAAFIGYIATPLVSGNSITASWTSNGVVQRVRLISAHEFSGVGSTPTFEQIASVSKNDRDTLLVGALTAVPDIDGTGFFTLVWTDDPNWNTLLTVGSSEPVSPLWQRNAYRVVSAAGAYTWTADVDHAEPGESPSFEAKHTTAIVASEASVDDPGGTGEEETERSRPTIVRIAPEALPHRFTERDIADNRSMVRKLNEQFDSIERQLLSLDPENRGSGA